MARHVLLLTNEWSDASAAQELPADNPLEFLQTFAAAIDPPVGTIWQVVTIPDGITGRETLRYAEQAAR